MSRPVGLADVSARIGEFGPLATLVTVSEAGRPHVGSVLVSVEPDHLAVHAGPRTQQNLRANPALTLTWMRDGADYQLIVDGTGQVDGEPDHTGLGGVRIRVESAILHRVAGRPDAGPSCVPLDATAPGSPS